jgi:hypothetical protein
VGSNPAKAYVSLKHLDIFSLFVAGGELKTSSSTQMGFQMVYFQTKNHNLGKFWKALDWKMLIHVMAN